MKRKDRKKQQIPLQEIMPAETRQSKIIEALPVLLMAAGMMGFFNAVWGEAAPRTWIWLLGILLGTGNAYFSSWLKEKGKPAVLFRITVLVIIWAAAGIMDSLRGASAWLQLLLERWNMMREGGELVSSLLSAEQQEIFAFTLIVAALSAEVLWHLAVEKKYLFWCGVLCSIGMLVPLLIGEFSSVSAGFFLAGDMGSWICSRGRLRWKGSCAGIVCCFLIFAVPALFLPETDLSLFSQIREETAQAIHEFRYGKDTLPEGNLYEASKLKKEEEEMMQIQTGQEKNVYLKGFAGGRYEDGTWKPLSGEAYRGEYAGMLDWLQKKQFDPLTQAARYYQLGDQANLPERNQMKLEITGASRYYIYVPSTLRQIPAKGVSERKDLLLQSKGLFGKRMYQIDEISTSRPSELMVADAWVEQPETEEQQAYSEAEAVYRKFVYQNYLTVDQNLYDQMQELFWSDETIQTDGIYRSLDRIRKVLEEKVSYVDDPGKIPEDADPITWFLQTSHKGNAMLYASVAVEALRSHGIPARYAEGYYLDGQDVASSAGKVSLTGKNAHAWVEIYFDGIGWLPADVTPGYYYNAAALQNMVANPDSIQKNVALENNSLPSEQVTGVENKVKKPMQNFLPAVRDLTLVLLGLAGILLLLATVFLIGLEVARLICLGPLEQKHRKEISQKRIRRLERTIYRLLELWGIDAALGWQTEQTDQALAEKFESVHAGEYRRVCHLIEKNSYGGIQLSPYEERTLQNFVEKLSVPEKKCGWKMRIRLRYACLFLERKKKKTVENSAV